MSGRKHLKPLSWGEILAVALASFVCVAVVAELTPLVDHHRGFDSDGRYYAAMAGETSFPDHFAAQAPWCYRVLGPWLVSLLSLPTLQAFTVLALISTSFTLLLFYVTTRHLGQSVRGAVLSVVFYASVFWSVRFAFYSPAYLDHLTQLFLVLMLYTVARRRFWLVPPLIAVACLHKEAFLVLSLAAYLGYGRHNGYSKPTSLLFLLATIAPGLAALITLRIVVSPVNDHGSFDWLQNIGAVAHWSFWPRFLLAALGGLGILPALTALKRRAVWAFLVENPSWLAIGLLGVPLLFGGSDKARLFLYMLPVMAATGAVATSEVLRNRHSSLGWLWIAASLVAHVLVGGLFARLDSFAGYLVRLVPMHAPETTIGPSLLRSLATVTLWAAVTALLLVPGHRSRK
jgi:hypothetical protein